MLQIVIWMLAAYLLFKGKELVMLADLVPDDRRDAAVRSAGKWQTVAIILAVIFVLLSLAQGNSVPSVPRF